MTTLQSIDYQVVKFQELILIISYFCFDAW